MATLLESPRAIGIAHECDICVIGGSCTGVFAAVRAARLGARVAIVEENGFFGGSATAGLVNIWHSIYDTTYQQQVIAGLTTEVIERLRKRQAVYFEEANEDRYAMLNTEELKIELDDLVMQAGVRPFLHAHFAAPIFEDERLVAVAIEDKTGRRAIKASYFIDATGDGHLLARAGFPCYKNSHLQPPTTCAVIRGLGDIRKRHPGFSLGQVVFDPRYPQALKRGFLWTAHVPGSVDDTMVAGTRVFEADCSDADQLTQAEIEGRRQVRAMCDILQEHFLPGGIVPLVALSASIGLRESRHARCLYTLTEADLLSGRRFPDAIANGTYRVDVHSTDGPGVIWRYLDGREQHVTPGEPGRSGRWRDPGDDCATFYQIPYRCLVPQGATNLLIAGRLIDADEGAFGAVRVMVNCNQTGEAAGTACYQALASNASVKDIDVGELRATMCAHGSIVL